MYLYTCQHAKQVGQPTQVLQAVDGTCPDRSPRCLVVPRGQQRAARGNVRTLRTPACLICMVRTRMVLQRHHSLLQLLTASKMMLEAESPSKRVLGCQARTKARRPGRSAQYLEGTTVLVYMKAHLGSPSILPAQLPLQRFMPMALQWSMRTWRPTRPSRTQPRATARRGAAAPFTAASQHSTGYSTRRLLSWSQWLKYPPHSLQLQWRWRKAMRRRAQWRGRQQL